MLRDVVAAFLDTVTEREFDAPLLALLSARGFEDMHFLHGNFEFGKDFIAKGMKPLNGDDGTGDPTTWIRHQFALQSKAGSIGQPGWRDVRQQLDEARLDDLAHPAFDTTLPRAGVVVLTGRLMGGAAVQAKSYRDSERSRGRPDFEVWDRETLLSWLVDAPEVGLAGTSDGPMLALAGAVDAGTVTMGELERHARSWLPPVPDTLSAATARPAELAALQRRASVEAAVLVNRLRRSGRLDLAAYVALHLLRAGWCHALAAEVPTAAYPVAGARPPQALAAIRLFAGCATELLHQMEPVADNPRALLDAMTHEALPHVVYPTACMRIAEILALLGLLAATLDEADPVQLVLPDRDALDRTVAALVVSQPGTAHPIADSFAVGILAPALLVARRQPEAVRDFVSRAAVWLADRYDDRAGGIGLAPTGSAPGVEVAQLLGGPYDNGPRRRRLSYAATVLADLAAVLPEGAALYADVVNEFLAVDAVPHLTTADERRAQWCPDGASVRWIARVQYREPLPSDGAAAAHFSDAPPPTPAWDAVALASVARNRHSVAAMRALLEDIS